MPSRASEKAPLADVVAEPDSDDVPPEAEIEAAVTTAPSTAAAERRAVASSSVTRPS